MLKTNVTIQVQHTSALQDDHAVMLSEALIRKWKIPTDQSIHFRFGGYKNYVKVIPLSRTGTIRIGESLASKLGVTGGSQLHVAYKSSTQTVAAGPLIGVLMSRYYAGTPDRPFGSTTAFCCELTDACRLNGAFVYFFTPEEAGASKHAVEGWTHTSHGWRKGIYPVPDVVYNRLTSRKSENKPSVQQFFEDVKQRHNTAIFNEKYLDKTDVFQALKQDGSLTRYLPESHLLGSYATFKSMCAKYPAVFLKPIRGSLGKGIIRVNQGEGGTVDAGFAGINGTTRKTYASAAKLYTALSEKLKVQKYQIQQGIPLITIGGRPVDFRALVQKDYGGKWTVTSVVGRIAADNHFVSNLARGGMISSAAAALSQANLGGIPVKTALAGLKRAALLLAEGVDKQIEADFGELGVDLGLDATGKVWLIEVNSKPSKNDNTQLAENKIRPSVKQIIQYARYLSGF